MGSPYVVSSRMVKHLVGELERLQPPIKKDKLEKITTASLKKWTCSRARRFWRRVEKWYWFTERFL